MQCRRSHHAYGVRLYSLPMKATFKANESIREYAVQSADNTFSAIAFAVISAQCALLPTVNATRLVRAWTADTGKVKTYAMITSEEKSMCSTGLSPRKIESLTYLWENRTSIYTKYLECLAEINGHLIWWNYCMDTLSGMGMVKAAFCTQLLFGELGCIDTHNARELGVKMPTGKSLKGRDLYLKLQSGKTSEQWWCDWCDFLAAKYPHLFEHGEQVSNLHEYAIKG